MSQPPYTGHRRCMVCGKRSDLRILTRCLQCTGWCCWELHTHRDCFRVHTTMLCVVSPEVQVLHAQRRANMIAMNEFKKQKQKATMIEKILKKEGR